MCDVDREALFEAIRSSWALDTCDRMDQQHWSPLNPARGHCVVTALVIHDHLGGKLIEAKVERSGQRVGFHGWNLIDNGTELDLTSEQFFSDEVLIEPEIFDRSERTPVDDVAAQYLVFAERVHATLAQPSPSGSPASSA